MPKLKQTETQRKNALLIAVIKKYQIINDISRQSLCEALRITQCTYYNRLKRPEKFTVDELRRLKTYLNIPSTEFEII